MPKISRGHTAKSNVRTKAFDAAKNGGLDRAKSTVTVSTSTAVSTTSTKSPTTGKGDGRTDGFDGASSRSIDRPMGSVVDVAGPATLTPRTRTAIDVPSASGVVALYDGQFLIVDDDKGIYLQDVESASRIKSTKKHEELGDLEGICRAPENDGVLVVNETTGNVFKLKFEDDGGAVDLGKPKKLGRLPKLSKSNSNKGWEGIDVMPGRLFDDGKPRLVGVHEGSPKRIGIFALPDLDNCVLLKLPKDVEKKLKDLSDVAVDPATGHLFVLSDESERLVELRVVRKSTAAPGAILESLTLETVGLHKIDAKKGEKPEGLDFAADGTLWVAMDGRSSLLALDVDR